MLSTLVFIKLTVTTCLWQDVKLYQSGTQPDNLKVFSYNGPQANYF